jgi:hypothetical protein
VPSSQKTIPKFSNDLTPMLETVENVKTISVQVPNIESGHLAILRPDFAEFEFRNPRTRGKK